MAIGWRVSLDNTGMGGGSWRKEGSWVNKQSVWTVVMIACLYKLTQSRCQAYSNYLVPSLELHIKEGYTLALSVTTSPGYCNYYYLYENSVCPQL
jgi:hypothetical protein